MNAKIIDVSPEYDGMRLDRTLEQVLPESGLRYRRRLCDEGSVFVDGIPRKAAFKVNAGQAVEVKGRPKVSAMASSLGVVVVKAENGFAAVYKPGGIHSSSIAGRENVNVESLLPDIFPGEDPVLLNRLDNPTSGLLLVALDEGAAARYHDAEEQGRITKQYFAKVHGKLSYSQTVRNAMDTDDRKKTRVLDEEAPEDLRWTEVRPAAYGMDIDYTLVQCVIKKGARHQIRAHLASIGHPIAGDTLYGVDAEGPLHLHHARIEFDGFEAEKGPWF